MTSLQWQYRRMLKQLNMYQDIFHVVVSRGGLLSCSVTGTWQYSSDLPQGELEVPCYYMFSEIKGLVVKARDRLEELKVKVSAIKENTAVTIMLQLNPLNILKTY